jgi:hypothetical protein
MKLPAASGRGIENHNKYALKKLDNAYYFN